MESDSGMKKKWTTSISMLALMTCAVIVVPLTVQAETENENSGQEQLQATTEPTAMDNYWQTSFQNGQLGNWQDLVGGTNRP